MLTIKAVILKEKQRVDLSYNVKLQFTLKRKVKRLSTSLFAKKSDLTKTGDFKKNTPLYKEIETLVNTYQIRCAKLHLDLNDYTIDQVFQILQIREKQNKIVDFIEFSKNWIKKADMKGAANYTTALHALIRFNKSERLNVKDITSDYLSKFKDYLYSEREDRVKKLEKEGKRIPSNRSISLYLIALKRLYKEVQEEYNNYELNMVMLPYSPFDRIKIPRQEATRKRAIPAELIKKIYELPHHNTPKGLHGTCRFDLAKDCFILSFCLIGMNSVDLFNVTTIHNNRIIYNRAKTKDRRLDSAKMEVDIPEIVLPIIKKYQDKEGKRLFNFYHDYANDKGFNKALNKGLKEIGALLKIEDLEYYAARHSWATIALNKCGVDKYTVHSALNHVDESMKVTDIYIERDFVAENEANAKVIKYVFGN